MNQQKSNKLKTILEMSKKTKMGDPDSRGITTVIRQYFKDRKIKAKVRKKTKTQHFGGTVTGGDSKVIELYIDTKEQFDIVDLLKQIKEAEFKHWYFEFGYWHSSLYVIEVEINSEQVYRQFLIGTWDYQQMSIFQYLEKGGNLVNFTPEDLWKKLNITKKSINFKSDVEFSLS